jgi:hypothetical protein
VHFWKAMFEHNYVCLFADNGGGPKPPETFPRHIQDILEQALFLAACPEAEGLPGYLGRG